MNTLTQTLRRNLYAVAATALTVALMLPAVMASPVFADQVTSRSITMSTSRNGSTAVTYQVQFTTINSMQSFVLDFCSDSPLVGATCTAPTGMVTSSAATSSGTWSVGTHEQNGRIKVTNSASQAAGAQTIVITGITNPTTVGTFYARVVTYTGATYGTYTAAATPGNYVDHGGFALSTTNDIEVSAAVLETLTFCVASAVISSECGDASSNLPQLALGNGSPKALDSSTVDTVEAYFQISTNASGSTSIRMRNGNASGGLNSGSNVIPPVNNSGTPAAIVAGTADFGMRVGTPAIASGGSGALSVAGATEYASGTNYNMILSSTAGYENNAVDSTYGSIIATATGAVNSVNVPLTFAATISPTTPAGVYTADLSLIASSSY